MYRTQHKPILLQRTQRLRQHLLAHAATLARAGDVREADLRHDDGMQLDSWGWVWAPILIYVGGIAISLLLLYLVIRAAVTPLLRA